MPHAHLATAHTPHSTECGSHSFPAVRPSPIWITVCRKFAGYLSGIGIGIVLALSLHCSACAATTRAMPIAGPDPYAAFITEASHRFGLPASWLRAVMQVESAGNPTAVSPKGAMGLMQLMPGTWPVLRARYHLGNDPFDPHDNILGGTAYLRELFDRFGAPGFLAAYNAGPKRFEDYRARLRPLPDETKRYLSTLAQMLPDLQIGGAIPPLRIATGWRAASLFAASAATVSSPNSAHGDTASKDTTAAKNFAMSPQSDGLFGPVQLPAQR